ncbi:MAG: glycosyltransferase [Flavobacteriales bacterium CG_4_10_14_0_2_um_filter_32_8]|nr:MAG: glycosyltransferase [Flavobacteriales bacterium CG_4_10_14_0_2_um_filter_32_8]PJB16093.1 MAG: glycosyltransferase [Flavobacteriales bacterium CG_4_9_14_3_um_filter_32_8]
MNSIIELSIVSPVYKAENSIDQLVERIIAAVSKLSNHYEIILVEDGGFDNSWKKIQENCQKFPIVKGIKLSRNYGQQHAIQAGLDAAKGEYVITMDCDLQDLPEEIEKLLTKAKEGYEIVVASRKNRKDDLFKKLLSQLFYKTLSYLTETKQDKTVANFVVYHRKAIDAMARLKDHNRYYPMLQQMIGFNYAKVEINHAERADGKSSYSFSKRLRLAMDTILTFSDKPLRLTVKFGVLLSFLSICAALTMVVLYFFSDVKSQGWASLALLISFFSGAIISVLGMVGLYVGRTFESVKNRPTYIIQEKIN